MTATTSTILKGLLSATFIIISSFYFSATAQNKILKSRVAVVATEIKTSIWVSDFPKNSSVVISDSENNLLSIVSTNDFGAAFVSLPENITNSVIVKTLDGEIVASNKALIKNRVEANVATTTTVPASKA